MSEQLSLDLAARAQDVARALHTARLHDLLCVLRARNGWMTRRQMERAGFGERELRELVELDAEAQIFSYPGNPGYKLFSLVTDAEFDRCVSLRNQGRKMVGRWLRYQRRWHRSGSR